jgi:hypothetical protein
MPAGHQAVLRALAPLAQRFYLGGGTAIAIQLGHRRSLDLDWFTPGVISDPAVLGATLREAGVDFQVTSLDRGTLHGVYENVRVSFLEYRYQLLEPAVHWPEFECSLASLADLACMKLSALAGRGAKRDFIDLYAIGTTGMGLPRMLDLYRAKYATDDVASVMMGLSYFDDAEEEDMPEMLWDLDWQDVKRAMERWVVGYTRGN